MKRFPHVPRRPGGPPDLLSFTDATTNCCFCVAGVCATVAIATTANASITAMPFILCLHISAMPPLAHSQKNCHQRSKNCQKAPLHNGHRIPISGSTCVVTKLGLLPFLSVF